MHIVLYSISPEHIIIDSVHNAPATGSDSAEARMTEVMETPGVWQAVVLDTVHDTVPVEVALERVRAGQDSDNPKPPGL